MVDSKQYWFVQPPNSYRIFPVAWQGWAFVFGAFALEIAVTRELQGAVRVIAFFAVALGFFLLGRGRTRVVSRDP